MPVAGLALTYRHASLPPGAVVVRARFRARTGDRTSITARMAEIRRSREATQPVRARTGGSTFRNPPGMRAWELIDAAGGRGLVRGGAACSEKHCNFLLNTGGATAADLEGLGEELRRRVHAASGVTLEWEIKRIGIPGEHVGSTVAPQPLGFDAGRRRPARRRGRRRMRARRGAVWRHLRRARGQPVLRPPGDRGAGWRRVRCRADLG